MTKAEIGMTMKYNQFHS